MAISRGKEAEGPDIWATAAGWLALVLGTITLNLWAWQQSWQDVWVMRGAILTFACFLTWLFGYWSQVVTTLKVWTRRGGLNAAAVTLGVLVAAVGINYLLHRHHWQKDLTKNQRFTLSDRSTKVIRGLKQPVQVTAFFSKQGRNRSQADNLLRQYKDASSNFKYRLVDPLEAVQLAEEKGLQTQEGVIFEIGSKKQQAGEVSEKEWTTSILKMARERQPKVFFLQGHGEMDYESSVDNPSRSLSMLAASLRNAQWQTEKLFLQGSGVKTPDPADAGVIIIADPVKPLAPDEEKRLNEYLSKGGRVLALLSPGGPNLSNICTPYGLRVGNDSIFDPRFGQQLIIRQPESHEINRGISLLLIVNCRSVAPVDKVPPGITALSLLKTDQLAAASPNFTKGKKIDTRAADVIRGPLSVASVGIKAGPPPVDPKAPPARESRVIAVGSSLSFSDLVLQQAASTFNLDFAANCVNWLGDETDLVSIEPKDTTPEQLPVTAQHTMLLAMIYWLEFPLLAIALGIYVYLKRR